MDPIIEPSKSADIGMRQLKPLGSMPPKQRWSVIAEGLPVLLRSADGLYAAASSIIDRPRIREILEGHAAEEAAKILILLDYVRCPLSLSNYAQRTLRAFYDHGARLTYGAACGWRPSTVNELRTYVDRERASHYIEGSVGEFILPNSQLFRREARLYADLTRNDDGSFEWNDPERLLSLERAWLMPPRALHVARSLERLGAFSVNGLALIHKIWAAKPFVGPEHAMESDGLIEVTLEALIKAKVVGEEATDADVRVICGSWQLPVYAIDTQVVDVPLAELHAAQERELWAPR